MVEKGWEWKPGWGRHTLAAITRVVCDECLVKSVCMRVCRNYHLIHGVILKWYQKYEYNSSEDDFMTELRDITQQFMQ